MGGSSMDPFETYDEPEALVEEIIEGTPETEEPAPEPEAKAEDVVEIESVPKSEPDRVAMPSVRADGTPDQTEDFEVLGDPSEG